MKKIYIWLIFTVLIGLLPIIARLITVNMFTLKDVVCISPVDIIIFGIVLHVSILNELNNLQKDNEWRLIATGISTIFIIGYVLLLSAAIASESKNLSINLKLLFNSAVALACISFIKCFVILLHYRKIELGYLK